MLPRKRCLLNGSKKNNLDRVRLLGIMEEDDGRQADLETISIHLVILITDFRPFRISINDRVLFAPPTDTHNQ